LDRGVRHDPAPPGEERADLDASQRDRHQQERPERYPDEDQVDRTEALERHLDEQVGDPPDHAHRHEERQAASAHRVIFYAVRLHMTPSSPARGPSPLLLTISSLFVATLVASNILAVK